MIGFRIVAGVGQHVQQANPLLGLRHDRAELVNIGPWSTADLKRQNEMIAGVADDVQLGITMTNRHFSPIAGIFEVE
jgi:hypothetical protein